SGRMSGTRAPTIPGVPISIPCQARSQPAAQNRSAIDPSRRCRTGPMAPLFPRRPSSGTRKSSRRRESGRYPLSVARCPLFVSTPSATGLAVRTDNGERTTDNEPPLQHVLKLEEKVVAVVQQADAGVALQLIGSEVAVGDREAERVAAERDLRRDEAGAAPIVGDGQRRDHLPAVILRPDQQRLQILIDRGVDESGLRGLVVGQALVVWRYEISGNRQHLALVGVRLARQIVAERLNRAALRCAIEVLVEELRAEEERLVGVDGTDELVEVQAEHVVPRIAGVPAAGAERRGGDAAIDRMTAVGMVEIDERVELRLREARLVVKVCQLGANDRLAAQADVAGILRRDGEGARSTGDLHRRHLLERDGEE